MKLSDIKYGEHLKIPRKAFYMQVDSLGNEYCKNFSSNLDEVLSTMSHCSNQEGYGPLYIKILNERAFRHIADFENFLDCREIENKTIRSIKNKISSRAYERIVCFSKDMKEIYYEIIKLYAYKKIGYYEDQYKFLPLTITIDYGLMYDYSYYNNKLRISKTYKAPKYLFFHELGRIADPDDPEKGYIPVCYGDMEINLYRDTFNNSIHSQKHMTIEKWRIDRGETDFNYCANTIFRDANKLTAQKTLYKYHRYIIPVAALEEAEKSRCNDFILSTVYYLGDRYVIINRADTEEEVETRLKSLEFPNFNHIHCDIEGSSCLYRDSNEHLYFDPSGKHDLRSAIIPTMNDIVLHHCH